MALNYLYLDDSGTRNPDLKVKDQSGERDAFCLGGVLIREEDKQAAKTLHDQFCARWGIDYPLHSSEIRHFDGNFSWLSQITEAEYTQFMTDLTNLLVSAPVLGHACVVDRPGYDARYREKYGRQTWSLCKTAFSVIVERAIKLSIAEGRRLIVYPEWSDDGAPKRLKAYYNELRDKGMPFEQQGSAKYQPLTKDQIRDTLVDFKCKPKSNRLMQLADLYLYPIRRSGYDLHYLPHALLVKNKKLIDCVLQQADIPTLGIKFSCFENVVRK